MNRIQKGPTVLLLTFLTFTLCSSAVAQQNPEQQVLNLDLSNGALVAFSEPIDITATENWKNSNGEINWEKLLRFEGTVTNNSTVEAAFLMFVFPDKEVSLEKFEPLKEGEDAQFTVEVDEETLNLTAEDHTLLRLGGFVTPMVLEFSETPGEIVSLKNLSVYNQSLIAEMMSRGAVRFAIVGLHGAQELGSMEIAGFDLPITPEAFPGGTFTPGESFFPDGTYFPEDSYFSGDFYFSLEEEVTHTVESSVRIVNGLVRQTDGGYATGLLVRAEHQMGERSIRLGEDITDSDGQYTIRYELLPGMPNINLKVVVIDNEGLPLQVSDIVTNAKPLEFVDFAVTEDAQTVADTGAAPRTLPHIPSNISRDNRIHPSLERKLNTGADLKKPNSGQNVSDLIPENRLDMLRRPVAKMDLTQPSKTGIAGLEARAAHGTTFSRRNARTATEDMTSTLCLDDICRRQQGLSALHASLWDHMPISVCWENATLDNEQERQWSRNAVESTWARESKVRFTDWGRCPGGDFPGVRIRIQDSRPHVKKLGNGLAGLKDGMSLNFTFNNYSNSCQDNREFCIRAIAVHEFGHLLGFAHEHNRADRIEEGCDDAPQGTDGDWQLTSYDLHSVMNYCNPKWNGDGSLSELDIQGLQRLYGSPTTNSFTLDGLGHSGHGAGLAIADINDSGRPDAFFMAYDAPNGANDIRYRVVYDLDHTGKPGSTGRSFRITGMGNQGEGASLAIGDITGNGKLDLLVMVIDAPRGKNEFRYKVGFDINAEGEASSWSRFYRVSGPDETTQGGGVALADINGNGDLDLVLMALNAPRGQNQYFYKIGFGIQPDGSVADRNWKVSERVNGQGTRADGAGLAIADLDGNGKLDMVLMSYDAPRGPNNYRYTILWDLDHNGRGTRGQSRRHMRGRGLSGDGADLAIYDIDDDGNMNLIVVTYDAPRGQNEFRYDIVFRPF